MLHLGGTLALLGMATEMGLRLAHGSCSVFLAVGPGISYCSSPSLHSSQLHDGKSDRDLGEQLERAKNLYGRGCGMGSSERVPCGNCPHTQRPLGEASASELTFAPATLTSYVLDCPSL